MSADYAIAMAMAGMMDNSSTAQQMASSDQTSSNFMSGLTQTLNQFNGDTAAIESFLTGYLAYHNESDQRDRLTPISALTLQSTSEMLGKLQANDVQIKKLQDDLQANQTKWNGLAVDLIKIKVEEKAYQIMLYTGLAALATPLAIFGVPQAMIAVAGAKLSMLAVDEKNTKDEMSSVEATMKEENTQIAALQKKQTVLLTSNSGNNDRRADELSGQAQTTLSNAMQCLQLGFLFLSNQNK